MNLIAHPELLELLAASHALGTLRGGARRRFETIAREQAPVRAAALVWQSRLASMTELQSPVVPDAAVWTRIRNIIDAEKAQHAIERQRDAANARDAAKPRGGWLGSLALWRGATAAGALATVLAVVVGLNLRDQLINAPAVQYVAVLSDDQAAASMLVTFDPKKKQLVLQRVGSYAEGTDKSLQLWALPPGGAPRSLGVLDNAPALRLAASESDVHQCRPWPLPWKPRAACHRAAARRGPSCSRAPSLKKPSDLIPLPFRCLR
jgi:anti-sigma-K factor RskA